MSRFFPDLIERPIDRQGEVDEFIERQQREEEDRQKKSIEDAKKQALEFQASIRQSCSTFKATCPEAWRKFEENLVQAFGAAYHLDRRTPLDLLRDQKDRGIYVDSQNWALTKAYLGGKIEILESMLRLISVDEAVIQKRLAERAAKKNSKSRLTIFRDRVFRLLRFG